MAKESKYEEMFYKMLLARSLEEALDEEVKKGRNCGSYHLCIGQEAAGVGACAALDKNDVVCTTHRGHSHYIARGLDLKKLCCEFWGRKEGYGKGRAGHMIVWSREHGVLGGSGIVGGSIPLAVGQALSFKIRKEKRVALSCFGDGASNTGSFHESLNMAAKWKLPVIFFCENNQYGLTVHVNQHLSVKDIAARAASYDMPGIVVSGNDMVEVYTTMKKVVDDVRSGKGPTLVEAKTYRIHGFATPSDKGGYQKKEELDYWKERDPILIGERYLLNNKILSKETLIELKERAVREIKDAIAYAQSAPFPEALSIPEDLFKGVTK